MTVFSRSFLLLLMLFLAAASIAQQPHGTGLNAQQAITSVSRDSSPSLNETLDWLTEKMEGSGYTARGTTGQIDVNAEWRVLRSSYHGCVLRVNVDWQIAITKSGDSNAYCSGCGAFEQQDELLISLADLVPAGNIDLKNWNTVFAFVSAIPQTSWAVPVKGTESLTAWQNAIQIISKTGKPGTSDKDYRQEMAFIFYDPLTAGRVKNALNHAIDLCKHRKEPF